MILRFQHITIYYNTHVQQLYTQQPDLSSRSFAYQHQAFLDTGFNWANYLHLELNALGYETQHIIANAEPMQKAWALENGVVYDSGSWYEDIALAQVKAFQPDILFINMSAEFVTRARALAPSLRLVIGWAGEPIVDDQLFRKHDLVLTCVPENVAFYRHAGLHCEHLNHAFFPGVLGRYTPGENPCGDTVRMGFIGNMYYGDLVHTQRAQLFHAIAQEVDLTIFGQVADPSAKEEEKPVGFSAKHWLRDQYYGVLATLHRAGLKPVARHLPRFDVVDQQIKRATYTPVFDALRAVTRQPTFGLPMYQLLSSFDVCLNAHAWSAYASNMRLYEATGVGTCLLTDWKKNIADLFEPDTEIVTYRNAEEAIEKARYLLDHETERQQIAVAGQARTLRDHTHAHRTQQLDEIVRKYL